MICPQCRRSVPETARFCSNCGLSFAPYHTPTEKIEVEEASETRPLSAALIGHVLARKYEIIAQLGEGGMGTVYRARRVMIGDEVAVKVLHQKYVANTEAVERFRREARAAAMLRHPNVVTIFDYGEAESDDAPAYIVMELVEGEPLRDLLGKVRRIRPERAVALMREVCAGVGAAHRRDIFHRDLKPDNIMVLPPDEDRERETVKVVDFGIAKLRDPAGVNTLTQTGAVMGTPFYMSPEQCRGNQLDARSDVYSLGATLYEMLAGGPPFKANSYGGVLSLHLTEPPSPFDRALNIPPELERVVMRALAKDPAGRQENAAALGRELQAALEPPPAPQPVVTQPAPTQPAPTQPGPTQPGPTAPTVEVQRVPPTAKSESGQQPRVIPPTEPLPRVTDAVKRVTSQEVESSTPPVDRISLSNLGLEPARPAKKRAGGMLWLVIGVVALAVVGVTVAYRFGLFAGESGTSSSVPAPTTGSSGRESGETSGGTSGRESGGTSHPATVSGELLGAIAAQRELFEVAMNSDGEWLASTANENRVRLWRTGNRSLIRELSVTPQQNRAVAVSPDGQTVAAGNDDGAIRVWRTGDGQLLHTMQGHTGYVFLVGFSPDGQTLVSASGDKTIRLWRVNDGQMLGAATVTRPDELIITISRDQRTVALLDTDRGVKLWSVSSNTLIRSLTGHRYEVTSGAFSADGEILALGSADGQTRLWRVGDGSLWQTLEGRGGAVGSVAFSPDGQFVVSGHQDGSMRLWRASDASLLKTLEGHRGEVVSLSFSVDGRTLASGSKDRTVCLWRILG